MTDTEGLTRSAEVYEGLLSAILEGRLARGARLPTEAELGRDYGVSRPVVRSALARLREDGIIASRRGSGSYVLRRPSRTVVDFVPIGSISDIQRCYEFRLEFESAAAALAAQRRNEADLAALKQAYERMLESGRDGHPSVDDDAAFHARLIAATHNDYYVTVHAALAPQIRFGIDLSRNLTLAQASERLVQVQQEHADVYRAIGDALPDAARAAMRRHIQSARDRMFEGVS
ncbi:FadR family transcriptional regulator (plasmid) [Paroceanicella profunda]|uniref:FadR family transcriptional regulator n=1 Tax=Paroceanicella profunda TaxID=2579971 RepID=A0A5B8FYK1_9RHOB|nr:FCD domain-containing protein [Paroceanicella profunda]QDL93986.1 FadR family transcriptional regulator [Paroceanicella profunda]